MHFRHLKHQSHYHFTGHPLSTQPVAGVMYSQLLVLFLKMKKKKKKDFFSFMKPTEKRIYEERTFSVGQFSFCFAPSHWSTLKKDPGWWRVYFVYCGTVRRLGHVLSHMTRSVLEGLCGLTPGCKVKHCCTVHLPTNSFASEKSAFLFQLSFNRFTTVVCLFNVTFLYFYVWEKYTGAKTISTGKIYEIYNVENWAESTTNTSKVEGLGGKVVSCFILAF